jgi:hypothetical protein
MALAKGVNSYVTVAEADSYFENRLDVAAWSSATPEDKAKALTTATAYLDDLRWIGYAVSDSQLLAFPRTGSYFDPRAGYEVVLDDNEVPTRVVNATFELAYHFLNNDGLLDDTGTVDAIQVGSISLQNVRAASKVPLHVKRLINPLLHNAGSGIWWRAN